MTHVTFCRACLYGSDHALGITFDHSGLCSGCSVHQEKDALDWDARREEILRLVAPYRLRRSGGAYDCIVPVTGAGDSYFTLHLVTNVLGLRPLTVHYNSQFSSLVGIQNLANLRETFNVDMVQMNVNPESLKRITRATLTTFGSVYWHVLAGQTAYPVQTAIRMGIPLIVWGPHQGVEQVGMNSHLDGVEMTRRYRKEHDLMGYEAEDVATSFDAIKEGDVHDFIYPDDSALMRGDVRGIYLSNYFRWDPYLQHLLNVETYGYQGVRNNRSFDLYDHADSNLYMGFHDWMKLVKCGYSKVTDQASREIRHGRMTREQALGIVRRFEKAPPRGLGPITKWLGASLRSLELVALRHRNKQYWDGKYAQMGQFAGWSTLQGGGVASSSPSSHGKVPVPEEFKVLGRGHPHLNPEMLN